jgi:hypothetical protein
MFHVPELTKAFNVTVPEPDVTSKPIPSVLVPKSVVDVSVYDAPVEFQTHNIVPALIDDVAALYTTYSK